MPGRGRQSYGCGMSLCLLPHKLSLRFPRAQISAPEGRRGRTISIPRDICSLHFADSDTYLVAAGYYGTLVWRTQDGLPVQLDQAMTTNRPRVRLVAASPHHPFIVSVVQPTILITNIRTGRSSAGIPEDCWSATFTPDGNSFLTGGEGGRLRIWDMRPILERQKHFELPSDEGGDEWPDLTFKDFVGSQVGPFLRWLVKLAEQTPRGSSTRYPSLQMVD